MYTHLQRVHECIRSAAATHPSEPRTHRQRCGSFCVHVRLHLVDRVIWSTSHQLLSSVRRMLCIPASVLWYECSTSVTISSAVRRSPGANGWFQGVKTYSSGSGHVCCRRPCQSDHRRERGKGKRRTAVISCSSRWIERQNASRSGAQRMRCQKSRWWKANCLQDAHQDRSCRS